MPSPYTKKYPQGRRQAVICLACGQSFDVPNRTVRRGNGQYCSRACKANAQRKPIELLCRACGRPMSVRPSEKAKGAKYCSWECRKVGLRGAGNPKWADDEDYRGWDWGDVRAKAMERDGHRCRQCGSDGSLVGHHVIPWKESHDNDLANVLTLCVSCHQRLHKAAEITRQG